MSLSAVEFCKVYIPMAKAGESAKAIAEKLGLGTDSKASQKVSQKATLIRKSLKEAAEKQAVADGLDTEATVALVKSTMAKMPKLKTRTRTASNLSAMLDEILTECDAPADEGEEVEDEQTEDAPE